MHMSKWFLFATIICVIIFLCSVGMIIRGSSGKRTYVWAGLTGIFLAGIIFATCITGQALVFSFVRI